MNAQRLLLQDGKLFGQHTMFSVIAKAAGLPEVAKDNELQSMECIVQLGQVDNSCLTYTLKLLE